MARDEALLAHDRKPAEGVCFSPPTGRPVPVGYKLLAAAAASLLLWLAMFWLGGYVLTLLR